MTNFKLLPKCTVVCGGLGMIAALIFLIYGINQPTSDPQGPGAHSPIVLFAFLCLPLAGGLAGSLFGAIVGGFAWLVKANQEKNAN